MFCFPHGAKLLSRKPPREPLPVFFTFVITGADGAHSYGHCLTFYERITKSQYAQLDLTSTEVASRVGQEFFLPKAFFIISRWNFPQFRTFLTALYQLSLTPVTIPLERVVINFVAETPAPPAGKVVVQYTIPFIEQELLFQRPPPNRRVSAMNLPFRNVFETLDLPNILLLWRCALAEMKILIHSNKISILTEIAEVICALLYPFTWSHVYIPVLPEGLEQVLQAPMPFIVGMTTNMRQRVEDYAMTEDIVEVNVDANEIVIAASNRPLPPPQRPLEKLEKSLRQVANAFDNRPRDWYTTVFPTVRRRSQAIL